ncbi:MAG TPA: aquaporin [Methylomirabilota bacterium]|nr:aquaporin [Methylomirabilota bacterium]
MRAHWPEYAIEAAGLGLFMVSACMFGTLLGHPASPVVHALPEPLGRRSLMAAAMGLTAIALIYSPWGTRSGAHFNPATTLMFWRLGKMAPRDAAAYVVAQALGGLAGVLVSSAVLGARLAHAEVRYVVTVPGPGGPGVALVAETAIAFVLMAAVLYVSNKPRSARFTGLVVGSLLAVFITLESPLSGTSLNPARTVASAIPASAFDALWIYFVAPPLGMLLAAEAYVRRHGLRAVYCAKLHHAHAGPCIFRCRYHELAASEATSTADVSHGLRHTT